MGVNLTFNKRIADKEESKFIQKEYEKFLRKGIIQSSSYYYGFDVGFNEGMKVMQKVISRRLDKTFKELDKK